jgi:ComF family protein
MRRAIEIVCRPVIDFLIPRRCVSCGETGVLLCASCTAVIARADPVRRVARDGVPTVVALGPYEGALRRAVLSAKFRSCGEVATTLGLCLAARVAWSIDGLVPVPLHPRRLRERGYNQSARLAEAIGDRLGAPCLDDALVRTRHTRPQSRLDLDRRAVNVAGAFALGARAREIRGRHILLVDDVITTGATARACASSLRDAGARAVYLACAAIRL